MTAREAIPVLRNRQKWFPGAIAKKKAEGAAHLVKQMEESMKYEKELLDSLDRIISNSYHLG